MKVSIRSDCCIALRMIALQAWYASEQELWEIEMGFWQNEKIEKQEAEILRLRASLRAANEQAEHFERLWYLRGDKIEKLQADKVDKAAWDINAVLSNQNDKLRKMLEEARNLLHKLTAIIPGNDTAGEEVAILLRAAAAALKENGDE